MRTVKSILIALSAALFFMGCTRELEVKVEFNENAYEMSVGDTLSLASEVKVENTLEAPQFTTSDPTVAKFVSEGVLVALAPGDITLTASVAGKSAKAQLRVNVVLAEKILLQSPDSVLVASDEWTHVVATVEPGNYNYENLEWSITASDETIVVESKKVSASEYKFKVAEYKENATVVVKVSDKNSEVSQSASIVLVEPAMPEVAAKIIRLDAPDKITESDQTWGTVIAEVDPEGAGDYDYANLVWEFTTSGAQEETGFASEKVSDNQYNIRFTTYKEGANVSVKVTDKIGGKFVVKTIAVEKKPVEGVTSIEVLPATLPLFVGETHTLSAKCEPSIYDQTLLVWESSNTDVVTVLAGKVTAVGEGVAKVKVSDSISGLFAECEVTVSVPVNEVAVRRIVLDRVRLTLTAGDSHLLKVTCYDEDGNVVENYGGLVWSASEYTDQNGRFEVVTVSPQGVIKAERAGMTTVTVAVESNRAVNAKCDVTVLKKEVKVEKLTLTPSEKTIEVGDYFSIGLTAEPDLSLVDNKTITYESSNPEVVTISNEGLVKGVAVGEAQITATAASGVSATAKVVVRAQSAGGVEDEVTDFTINLAIDNEPSDENMKLPQFETLQLKVSYTNAYVAKNTRWEVSDPTLATVTAHDGYAVVEAIYDGMMTDADKKPVTITHYAGKQVASKTIDITRAMPKSIELVGLPENNVLYLGDTFGPDFRAKVYPEQASQEVTFWGAVELFSVANGTRPAYKTGYYELCATAKYMGELISGVQTTVYLTVKPKVVEGGVLSATNLTLEKGKDMTLVVDFTPANNANYDYDVVWESSNPSVATVENGKVTGNALGTATVTAKLSNGDILSCEVNVIDPVPAYANVGDYYYSDGSVSTELDMTKTVVGIVFAVLNPTQMGDSQLAADHPEATHGLVVSLKQTKTKWQNTEATFVSDWLKENMNYYYLTDESRMCGYSNTVGLKAYNAQCETKNQVRVVRPNDSEVDSKSSGWYVPSYAELIMLYHANASYITENSINVGMISEKIEALIAADPVTYKNAAALSCERLNYNYDPNTADAPNYWSSTEHSLAEAAAVHMGYGGANNKQKIQKNYYFSRYILAF